MKRPVLGVIASQFPETHETFIVRELLALAEAGVDLRIYSLKACRDWVVQEAARSLLTRTTTVAWNDLKTWGNGLGVFLRRPGRGLSALGQAVRFSGFSGPAFFKTLVVWVQAMALSDRMRRDGVTHLHAHWATMPTTAAALVSRWLGVPFSFTAHAWDIFVRNPSLREKIRRAVRVITCTEYNRRYLTELCPEAAGKIVLNYHGVDVDAFARLRVDALTRSPLCRPLPPEGGEEKGERGNGPTGQRANAPTFLSIGRLVETKGFDTLLEAYRILKERGTDFLAVIVGEGPLRGRLERAIRRHGLSDVVTLRLTMPQGELKDLYAQADAFVLPSRLAANGDRDGIPNVILEAMAMGRPVVATRISGISEAVAEGQTGLLVPPNDPQALAAALERLIREPGLCATLGANGRARAVTEFNENEHMSRLVANMKELVTSRLSLVTRAVRVAYVIWSLEIGGAERVVAALARRLDRQRFSPMVVCLNGPGRLADALEQGGVPVIALHKRPGPDFLLLPRLARLLRQRQVRLVHTHLWGAGFWGRLAARMAGVPVVIAHEHGMQPWRNAFHFWVDRWLARWTDQILFASKGVMRVYRERTGIGAEKCRWVANGVDVEAFARLRVNVLTRSPLCRPLPPGGGEEKGEGGNAPTRKRANALTILSVGRLAAEKGHEDLLKAFAHVIRKFPRARLVLVGEGSEEARLRQIRENLGLNGQVVFAGTQNDVSPWLASADLYVQPSRREGFSLAILEAMAAGLPVVATRVGDVEQVIRDGQEGYLVPPGRPDLLAEQIIGVLTDTAWAHQMGQAGRARVEDDFSLQAMVRANEAVYEELLSGAGQGPPSSSLRGPEGPEATS